MEFWEKQVRYVIAQSFSIDGSHFVNCSQAVINQTDRQTNRHMQTKTNRRKDTVRQTEKTEIKADKTKLREREREKIGSEQDLEIHRNPDGMRKITMTLL